MIEVRPVQPADQVAWDLIATSSDDAWLSHSWDWNLAIEEDVMGGQRRSLVVLRDRRVVGIVPQHLHSRRLGPLVRRVLYANYWAGGGVALANDVVGQARAECIAAALGRTHELAKSEGVDKLMLFLPSLANRNLRGEPEARQAIDRGFLERSSSALVIRLAGRTERDVWEAMEGRARTKVRKAERSGVCVARSSPRDALEPLYALHVETCRRTGALPYPREYFEATLASGFFHVFVARFDGRTIGALTVAIYAGRALCDVSASVDEALRLGANNLLMWRSLQWLMDVGAQAYELGMLPVPGQPSPPKLAAIAWYHRSFGCEEVPAFAGEFHYRRRREAVHTLLRGIARWRREAASGLTSRAGKPTTQGRSRLG